MKHFTFCNVAIFGAGLFFVLALILIVDPRILLASWGVDVTPEAAFMGRRLATGFVGFSVILWMARKSPRSEARSAIGFGIAAALVLVALFGTYELARGFASVGIISAILTEVVLAVALIVTVTKE